MAAFVQIASNTVGTGTGSGGLTNSATLVGTVAGNMLVAVYTVDRNTLVVPPSPNTVNQGFVEIVEVTNPASVGSDRSMTGVWFLPSCPGGSITVTMSTTGTDAQDSVLALLEYSGAKSLDGAPKFTTYDDLGNPGVSSGVVTSANTGDLLLGVFGDPGANMTVVTTGGMTQRFNNSPSGVGSLAIGDIVSTTSKANLASFAASGASFTDPYQVLAVVFKAGAVQPNWPITTVTGM